MLLNEDVCLQIVAAAAEEQVDKVRVGGLDAARRVEDDEAAQVVVDRDLDLGRFRITDKGVHASQKRIFYGS